MSNLKTLKSIDVASATIIGTGVQVLFSIILAIILLIIVGIVSSSSFVAFLSIASTIIFGTIAFCIFSYFTQSSVYNWLAKRINPLSFSIEDDGTISKIATAPTAINLAIICTILSIIIYLMTVFVVPLILSTIVQVMMLAGQMQVATILYNMAMLYTSPAMVIGYILGIFIMTCIYTLISVSIYNLLAAKGYGAKVKLNEENKITSLESIDVKSTALIYGVISLIIGLVTGIITAVISGSYLNIVAYTVSGLIGGIIVMALIAIFYNFLSKKLGKLKMELVNE